MQAHAVHFHRLTLIVLALCGQVSLSHAEPESNENSAVFRAHDAVLAGSAIVIRTLGHAYVYADTVSDGRKHTPAFAVGKAPRREYEFFSAQHEEALWQFKQEKLLRVATVQALPPVKASISAHKTSSISKLNWPRVLLRDANVCVPILQFSDANDWRDHLTCWINGDWQ